ncbi:MAG: multidrug ABC transporter ATP-binding protein [Acidobacteria bacterium]|nr:MAG: multidrug ABC transporter ATP-binding protein [Acidobacteriota bacterium]
MLRSWRVFSYIRPYLPVFTVSFILMGVTACLEALLALLIKPIFDNILGFAPNSVQSQIFTLPISQKKIFLEQINPFPFKEVWLVLGCLIVIATLFKGLAEYFSTYLLNYMGQSIVMDLRNQLYERVLNQSSSFFHTHSTGRLISRITNDIEKIQFASSTALADALKQGLTFLACLYLAFAIDWRLALASFLLAPLVIYPSKFFGKKIHKSSRSSQDKMEEISNILQETITGHRIVKAFGMEKFELSKFKQATRRLARINLTWVRVHAIASPFMELLGAITIALMLFYAQNRISNNQMTAGSFAVFLVALLKMYEPVRRISGIYNTFQQAKGASSKVFEIMEEPPEVTEKSNAIRLSHFRQDIEFRNVSFNYNDSRLPVLRNVDLKVSLGEVIALVGTSGSGKSTLVNLIPRFFDPTDGQILIDGIDIRDVTLDSLRSMIGMVSQETVLFNDTVHNNICYGREHVGEDEIIAAAKTALAHDFIEQLPKKYDSIIGERGQKLSGGQRQRIAIARAILKNSPILILDEATSALDSESEILVQKALSNLIHGRTVFVIAHRLSTIRQADRIVVIDRGQISEIGTHTDLVARGGIYQRLHALQFVETDTAQVS